MISHRQADFQSIFAKVDAMTDQQRDEFCANFVREHGLAETLSILKNNLANIASSKRTAQIYEGFRDKATPVEERPSKLKHALNVAGDWGYLLTLLLMIGTAGASDTGGSWTDIIRGFALTLGAGFLTWSAKKLAPYVK